MMTTLTFEAPQTAARPPGPSPIRAIRHKCLDCMGGSFTQVKRCVFDGVHSKPCPLWPFRFGCRRSTAERRHGREFLSPADLPGAGQPVMKTPPAKFTPSPLTAIRRHCMACCNGKPRTVKSCALDGFNSTRCDLWPFRFGVSPATASRRYGDKLQTPREMPPAGVPIEALDQ